ncbi:MAG: hypothetical protein SO170_06580 [Butyribacter sp.]|nr:hypothetical protein [Butyribacter sp.]
MKKIRIVVLLGMLCICCAGCGNATSNKVKTTNRSDVKSEAKAEETIEIDSYDGRDYDLVMEHLNDFPTELEELKNSNIYFCTNAVSYHREILDTFMEKVENGEKCSLYAAYYPPAGNVIPTYIQYNGKNFYVFEKSENSDTLNSEGIGSIKGKIFKYLSVVDVPNSAYEDIDFSDMTEGIRYIVLANKQVTSVEECVNLEDSYSNLQVSPFNTEDELESHKVNPYMS